MLYFDNVQVSSANDDQAGGICCAVDINSSLIDVYVAGTQFLPNGTATFLGQHYFLNSNPNPTLILTTNYTVNNISSNAQFGTGVDVFDHQNGVRSISFSGTQGNPISNGTNPFYTHIEVDLSYPSTQPLTRVDIATTSPTKLSTTTDVAINHFSGEINISGRLNENGQPFANPNACGNSYPLFTYDGNEMFLYSYGIYANCPFTDYTSQLGGIFSRTSSYSNLGCDEKINNICANMANSQSVAFMTGSFLGNGSGTCIKSLHESIPPTYIPQNNLSGTDCFISRVKKFPNINYYPKHEEISHLTIANCENNLDDIITYPNPAINHIFVKSREKINSLTIQLLDITGRNVSELYCGPLDNESISLNIAKIESGIYIIQFTGSDSKSLRKLIIQ